MIWIKIVTDLVGGDTITGTHSTSGPMYREAA